MFNLDAQSIMKTVPLYMIEALIADELRLKVFHDPVKDDPNASFNRDCHLLFRQRFNARDLSDREKGVAYVYQLNGCSIRLRDCHL